jgi:short-subunit dehydrogenase
MKKAIVIGASSGIGRELALLLAAEGYSVGITGRRLELLTELSGKNQEVFIPQQMDITCLENTVSQLNELVSKLGGLDLLVLSSGTGDINEMLNFEVEKCTIDTNVTGFTNIVDWAYQFFKNQNSGHLVAITSIAGLRGNGSAPAYNATKAFQINYLEGLSQKVHKQKLSINITDIRPGFVDTDMAKGEGKFWVSTIEKASRQIVKAIHRKKKVVYITKRWGIIAFIFRVLPRFIYDRMG